MKSALIVDDDAFTRSSIGRFLRKLGIDDCRMAGDGAEAIRSAQAARPDVVICDLNMPDMDGIETLRQLAAIDPDQRIIVSSSTDPRVLRSAEQMAGSFGLRHLRAVPKPLTPAKLREALDELTAVPSEVPAALAVETTAADLVRGLAAGEVTAFFQPKVEIAGRRLVGAEALVRWRHPRHGVLGPDVVLPLAAGAGLTEAVTDAVLTAAARHCAIWRRQDLGLSVSINLAVAAASSRDLPGRMRALAAAHGLAPAALVLEVTEDGWLHQSAVSREVLTRLRVQDFGLSIDDFGTGYSTLQQLLQAPFNELKIDQSFVRNALHDRESAIVLQSSIAMAHQLTLKVVAEGVETEAQWALLASLGCDIAQGYYIARPLPGEDFLGWAQGWAAAA